MMLYSNFSSIGSVVVILYSTDYPWCADVYSVAFACFKDSPFNIGIDFWQSLYLINEDVEVVFDCKISEVSNPDIGLGFV